MERKCHPDATLERGQIVSTVTLLVSGSDYLIESRFRGRRE